MSRASKIRNVLLALVLSAVGVSASSEQIYEWTDEFGKKHFSQEAPEEKPYQTRTISGPPKAGIKIADDYDIADFKNTSKNANQEKSVRDDSWCIKKRRLLYQVESGLEREDLSSEKQKALDLKSAIAERCGESYLKEVKSRKNEKRRSGHCLDKKLALQELLDATSGEEGPASEEMRAYLSRECGSKYLP